MTLNIKKYLKTGALISLCAATALCTAACKNPFSSSDDSTSENNTVTEEQSASDTETMEKKENTDSSADNSADKTKENNNKENDNKESPNNTNSKPENTERTPETDRQEIQNNIRDAEELIENDMPDDARAVIRILRSRDLTDEEKAQVDSLEKRLITVSD